ncbi:MAG: PilN domain-containing protein [Terriglobales bacterium]
MRLDINLATRPYEDARKFWARWGVAVGLLGVLTLLLLSFTVNEWRNAGKDRQEIAGLQAQIAERDHERAQDQAVLDQPANRSTRDQSQFVNGLIQRKSFSWTRVFEDLEQVMPPNLHVVSLRPELNEQDQMQLDMRVAGDNRSAAIELVHRMEGSKHFQGAQLMSESQEGGNGSNVVVASVIAIYVPDVVPDVVTGAADSADRSNQ